MYSEATGERQFIAASFGYRWGGAKPSPTFDTPSGMEVLSDLSRRHRPEEVHRRLLPALPAECGSFLKILDATSGWPFIVESSRRHRDGRLPAHVPDVKGGGRLPMHAPDVMGEGQWLAYSRDVTGW